MVRIIFLISLASLLLTACQSTPSAPSSKQADQPSTAVQTSLEKSVPTSLIYEPSLTFDYRLSLALRNAEQTLTLQTPAEVKLTAIPADLDIWLSRVKKAGGSVKAKALPEPGAAQRRGFNILLDVTLYLLDAAKDEMTYGPADDFNALLHFEPATGDVREITFQRK